MIIYAANSVLRVAGGASANAQENAETDFAVQNTPMKSELPTGWYILLASLGTGYEITGRMELKYQVSQAPFTRYRIHLVPHSSPNLISKLYIVHTTPVTKRFF